eukprot:TRINITY_DN726_c0_g2_i1.p1 TRINITY_DN726_c0_g2~~TRINITY_DN726_c0_g2_i1.p1  ORF type:complete len:108 (-),score=16.98 TRINITY_DN726_c0_g2_i1:192-515(-)
MAASRNVILPLALLALVCVQLLSVPSFVFGGRSMTSRQTSLRSGTAQRALPAEFVVDGSSVETALQVTNYGMAANIVFLTVPVIFLVTLYLQSERNKARIASGELEI